MMTTTRVTNTGITIPIQLLVQNSAGTVNMTLIRRRKSFESPCSVSTQKSHVIPHPVHVAWH